MKLSITLWGFFLVLRDFHQNNKSNENGILLSHSIYYTQEKCEGNIL